MYKTTCLDCKEKTGKIVEYYGETSKTAYERGLNHTYDFWTGTEDSHMYKHQTEVHAEQENPPEFSMTVLKKHSSAFRRQIHEAVVVEMKEKNGILNSKGIYDRCSLPRLTVKWKDREIRELENEIEKVKTRKKKREEIDQEKVMEEKQPPQKKTRMSAIRKKKNEEDPPEKKENRSEKLPETKLEKFSPKSCLEVVQRILKLKRSQH